MSGTLSVSSAALLESKKSLGAKSAPVVAVSSVNDKTKLERAIDKEAESQSAASYARNYLFASFGAIAEGHYTEF